MNLISHLHQLFVCYAVVTTITKQAYNNCTIVL